MAQWHGQFSRIETAIQYKKSLTAFPNWGADFFNSRLSRGYGWGSDGLGAAGRGVQSWLGDTPGGNSVVSRELSHSLSRYPYRTDENYRYTSELAIDGNSSSVYFTVMVVGLDRASDKGIDQGARSGYIGIDSCYIEYTDGSSETLWVGTDLFGAINGWAPQKKVYTANFEVVRAKPIRLARLAIKARFGAESYHDIGDRSEASWWTPTRIVGHPSIGCGYQFGDPAGNTVGLIDRENTYRLLSSSDMVILSPQASVARSGSIVFINKG